MKDPQPTFDALRGRKNQVRRREAAANRNPGANCDMYVSLSDPGSFRDLQEFLRRCNCVAEQSRPDRLEVYVPEAPNEDQARKELNARVAAWQARNPGREAHIVGADGSDRPAEG